MTGSPTTDSGRAMHGRHARAIDCLAGSRVWSLQRLDRFIWSLDDAGLLNSLDVLGCWVVSPERFVCVLRNAKLGPIGMIIDRHETDRTLQGPLDQLMALDAGEVSWRGRGWVKDGVTWNQDPSSLVTPWKVRPPQPDDPLVRPEGDSSLIPRDALMARTLSPPPRSGPATAPKAQDMWAATTLTELITWPTTYSRSALRLAAAWVCAPDSFAYVETHLWPPSRDRAHDAALLNSLLLPGQRHLRFGEYQAPTIVAASEGLIPHRHSDMELDSISTYPQAALGPRVLRDGILWDQRLVPRSYQTDMEASARMGAVLHAALD